MPNPKGNPGNKGGGRGPVSLEMRDRYWHLNKWESETKTAELTAKIKSGVFSVRDVFLLKALQGNERILKVFSDKVLPDLTDITSKGESISHVVALPDLKNMPDLSKVPKPKITDPIDD
jgi:hypothetical protein